MPYPKRVHDNPTMPGPGRGKFLRVSETRFALPQVQVMAEESEDATPAEGLAEVVALIPRRDEGLTTR